MSKFAVKDSGHRRKFNTGAQRDRGEGKPRYYLIPPLAKRRLAMVYTLGADKYEDWNWALGMPFSEFLDSLERHLEAYKMGEPDEDHLGAICFNAFCIMHFEEMGMSMLDDRKTIITRELLEKLLGTKPEQKKTTKKKTKKKVSKKKKKKRTR